MLFILISAMPSLFSPVTSSIYRLMKNGLGKWAVRWSKPGWSSELKGVLSAAQSLAAIQQWITSGLFWSLILGLVLAINDSDDGTECILSKFTDDTQSGGVVNKPNTHAPMQEGQWLAGKWVGGNPMKFSQVPHQQSNNPVQHHRLQVS